MIDSASWRLHACVTSPLCKTLTGMGCHFWGETHTPVLSVLPALTLLSSFWQTDMFQATLWTKSTFQEHKPLAYSYGGMRHPGNSILLPTIGGSFKVNYPFSKLWGVCSSPRHTFTIPSLWRWIWGPVKSHTDSCSWYVRYSQSLCHTFKFWDSLLHTDRGKAL